MGRQNDNILSSDRSKAIKNQECQEYFLIQGKIFFSWTEMINFELYCKVFIKILIVLAKTKDRCKFKAR